MAMSLPTYMAAEVVPKSQNGTAATNGTANHVDPAGEGQPKNAIRKMRPSLGSTSGNVSLETSKQRSTGIVTISDNVVKVEVPSDQLNAVDVWNSYAPVGYVSKKEQRRINKAREVQARDLRECFFSLIDINAKTASATSVDRIQGSSAGDSRRKKRVASKTMGELGYGAADCACISLVMSLWPSFPVSLRPALTPTVELAMERIYNGTAVCIFNEILNVPMRCTSALRLLRNIEGDEGSIAIYTSKCDSVIEGYIPLAFIDSVTQGLQPIEKAQFLTSADTIICTNADGGGEKVALSAKRAFTLHCSAAQRFYVTFVTFTDADLETWLLVTQYFALLNGSRKAYDAVET